MKTRDGVILTGFSFTTSTIGNLLIKTQKVKNTMSSIVVFTTDKYNF